MEEPDNNNNNNKPDPDSDQNSAEEVYGVVRTSPPQQQQQQQPQQQPDNVVLVRDPAKEIYGFLRSSGRGGHLRGHQPHVFGSVRTHAPPKTEPTYLDVLQQKFYGQNQENPDQAEPSYGVVRHHAPENSGNSGSFETVRGLMSADSSAETFNSGNSGSGNEEGSSFDLIRERLLNTRNRNRNNPDPEKSLRRKNSRKRRRNVRPF